MDNLSLLVIFFAGILSFLSPCVVPLVPVYVGDLSNSLSSAAGGYQWRTMVKTLFFVAGFSVVLVILGAAAGAVGSVTVQYQWLWNKIAGAVLVVFGVHLLGILPAVSFLNYEKRLISPRPGIAGPLKSFVMGAAFSSGWTPCVGPVLSSVLALAVTSQTAARGAFLMSIFSLGLAAPFIAIGFGLGKAISFIRKLGRFLRILNFLSGVLVILIGLVIFFDAAYLVTGVLRQYLPVI